MEKKALTSIRLFLKLLMINFLYSVFGAILGWFGFLIFPQFIAETVKYYGYLQKFIGIKHWENQPSINSALITILVGNGLSTLAIFATGLFSWGKIISFLIGIAMSFILFTGPMRHGNPINLNIIILMIIEMAYRMLAVSLGSFLTTKFLDKTPKSKKISLKSDSKLSSPTCYTNKKIVGDRESSKISIISRNILLILVIILIIVILLVSGALFEVLVKI